MNTIEFINEFTRKNVDCPEIFNQFLELFSQNFDINKIITNTNLTLKIDIRYEDRFQISIYEYGVLYILKITLGKSDITSVELNNDTYPCFNINCINYQLENDVMLKLAYFLNYLLTYPAITTISIWEDLTKNELISIKELLYKTLDTGIYATTLHIDYDVILVFNNLDLSKITNLDIQHKYLDILVKDRDKFKSLTYLRISPINNLSGDITINIVKLILDCNVINNTILIFEIKELLDILTKFNIEFSVANHLCVYKVDFINDSWERLDAGLK
jgi:hypothetical protein